MPKPNPVRHAMTSEDYSAVPSKRKAMLDFPPAVYAVRLPGGIIKFGYTCRLVKRIEHYGPGAELLGLYPGTFDHEQAIHRRLRPHLASGREYYHPTPEVIREVNALRALGNLPAI